MVSRSLFHRGFFYLSALLILFAALLLRPVSSTVHAQVELPKVSNDVSSSVWSSLGGEKTYDDFVNTLYERALGRDPDTGGYGYWVGQLNGASSSTLLSKAQYVADGFFNSSEYLSRHRDNEGYVEDLYEGVLQRDGSVSNDEINGWVSALNAGTSRADILNYFVGSPEFTADVNSDFEPSRSITVPASGPFPWTYSLPAGEIVSGEVSLTPAGQTYYDSSDGDYDACPATLTTPSPATITDNNVDEDDGTSGDGTGSCTYTYAMAQASQCTTVHVEIDKRNGDSDRNVIARYVMNKHFCYDGTKVTSSDQADVRGYVTGGIISGVYEFKGNISTQNGSSTDGSSAAQGNFALKIGATLPEGFSATDLGLWQPTLSIVPHGDGGFDYAPSSGYNGIDQSTIHDIVRAYHLN